jgi:hypothetical protein
MAHLNHARGVLGKLDERKDRRRQVLTEIVIPLWDDKAVRHPTFSESVGRLSDTTQPLILSLLWNS